MSLYRKLKNARAAAFFAVCAFICSCTHPTLDDVSSFEEAHSVWQYLSVYSVYQDRVPTLEESFNLLPQEMFLRIHDTLRGTYYTWYLPLPSSPGAATIPSPRPTVLTPLTDQTVYFRFSEFNNDIIVFFRNNINYIASFDNIIVDVRNNGGGYMSVVTEMIEQFLPNGTEYIEYRYRHYNANKRIGESVVEIARTRNADPAFVEKNVAVLVNRFSASASEILASGLKDGMNAHIIGGLTYEAFYDALDGLTNGYVVPIPTFGKGLGQRHIVRHRHPTISVTYNKIGGISERTGSWLNIGIMPDSIPLAELELAMRIINDTNYTASPIAEELLNSDSELYFALRIFEPWVGDQINGDGENDDDIENDEDSEIDNDQENAAARLKRNAVRTPGILESIDQGAPIGVYVIDTDELFKY